MLPGARAGQPGDVPAARPPTTAATTRSAPGCCATRCGSGSAPPPARSARLGPPRRRAPPLPARAAADGAAPGHRPAAHRRRRRHRQDDRGRADRRRTAGAGRRQRLAVLCSPAPGRAVAAGAARPSSASTPSWCCPAPSAGWNATCRQGETLFDRHPHIVVSTDFIKRPGAARRVPAHGCPDLRDRRRGPHLRGRRHRRPAAGSCATSCVRDLATTPTRHLILVTATPHSGKDEAFRNLLGLLDARSGYRRPGIGRGPASGWPRISCSAAAPTSARTSTTTPRSPGPASQERAVHADARLPGAVRRRPRLRPRDGRRTRRRAACASGCAGGRRSPCCARSPPRPAAAAATLLTRAGTSTPTTSPRPTSSAGPRVLDLPTTRPTSRPTPPPAPTTTRPRATPRSGGGCGASPGGPRPGGRARTQAQAEATKIVKSCCRRLQPDRVLPVHRHRRVRRRAPARRAAARRRGRGGDRDAAAGGARGPHRRADQPTPAPPRAGRHRLPVRGREPAGAVPGRGPLRPGLEPDPPRAARGPGRPVRPAAADRPRGHLYGTDNGIDGIVLDVLLRKHEKIRKALGVSVPVPDRSDDVVAGHPGRAAAARQGARRAAGPRLRAPSGATSCTANGTAPPTGRSSPAPSSPSTASSPTRSPANWPRSAPASGPAPRSPGSPPRRCAPCDAEVTDTARRLHRHDRRRCPSGCATR